jgi:hypothetical protein
MTDFYELRVMGCHSVESLFVGREIDGFCGGGGPFIAFLNLAEEGWCGKCVPNGCLIAQINGSFVNVKLSAVEWDARYGGTVSGIDGLVVNGFMVSVAVEMRVTGEIGIPCFVVLVAFHVGEGDVAR